MMLLSLVLAHFRDLPDAVRLALDYVLRRKALAAEAASVQRRAILSGRYPQLRVSLQRLDLLRGQVASRILRGLGAHETPQQYQQLRWPGGATNAKRWRAKWPARFPRCASNTSSPAPTRARLPCTCRRAARWSNSSVFIPAIFRR